MSDKEVEAINGYPWEPGMCLGGLWSWRGAIFKKYMGYMPTPEEFDEKPTHPFFDPDFVSEGWERRSTGETIAVNFIHNGRLIRRNEKRWKNYVVPRIAELRAAGQWSESCTVNGHPV